MELCSDITEFRVAEDDSSPQGKADMPVKGQKSQISEI